MSSRPFREPEMTKMTDSTASAGNDMLAEADYDLEHPDLDEGLLYGASHRRPTPEEIASNSLVGSRRKRRAGASNFTQKLYVLLSDHPEGLTARQIVDLIGHNWLETDAYRAYAAEIANRRKPLEYGTPPFKDAAKLWWTQRRLSGMKSNGFVRRENRAPDSLWFINRDRLTPRVAIDPVVVCHYRRLDVKAYRDYKDQSNKSQVGITKLKCILSQIVQDGRLKGDRWEELRSAYRDVWGP